MVACVLAGSSHGEVIEFGEPEEWIAAVGPFTTIDFTGFVSGTVLTDQYADLGVLFTDGNDQVDFGPTIYPNDEWGLDGNGDVDVSFDTPQLYLAVDFPGILFIELYSQGELIDTTNGWGSGGVGFFFGFLSSEPFDAVRIIDPIDNAVFIDDLHFGIPAPGPLWPLAVAALCLGCRRRSAGTRGRPGSHAGVRAHTRASWATRGRLRELAGRGVR
jgi:hypothetical protein